MITNANSTFTVSQLSYRDTKQNTVAIANNDQLVVRNQLALGGSFTAATSRKSASISRYRIIFNGNTQDKASVGSYDLGMVDSSSNLELQVKAIDSMGNSWAISNSVQIPDWVLPIINSAAKRVNNYEDEVKLKSNVEISSIKNINTIEPLQYRTKKTSDSVWGSWVNFQNNAEISIVLDKPFAWNLGVRAADKFGSSIQSLTVPKGMPPYWVV